MASNQLPSKQGRLFALAEDMADGAQAHTPAIDIKQNTEAVIRTALAAASATEIIFGAAGVAKKTGTATRKAADSAGKVLIENAQKRFSKFYGNVFNAEWAGAGWPNGSLAVPSTQDERFALVTSIRDFLAVPANAAMLSTDMEVTIAISETVHTNLSNARAALAQNITDCGTTKLARDAADANLRNRMEGLIGELETLLSDVDPRWHAFGLSRPADEETPEAPSTLIITLGPAGTLLADWDDALRADSYRVWILIVGTDTEFHPIETVFDSDATLAGLLSGATVKVQVTSKNAAGESGPSPIVEVVVP